MPEGLIPDGGGQPGALGLRSETRGPAWSSTPETRGPDLEAGNLGAGNLGAGNLGAGNLGAGNLGAGNLGAGNLGAGNLGAGFSVQRALLVALESRNDAGTQRDRSNAPRTRATGRRLARKVAVK